MLRLTSLAPDIVEAILAGEEPSGLSIAALRRGLLILWNDQRDVLGCCCRGGENAWA